MINKHIPTFLMMVLLCSTIELFTTAMKQDSMKHKEPSSRIKEIKTIEEYREALGTSKPTIIKIYTTWCSNCTAMQPAFHATARKHHDEAMFIQINADTNDKGLREVIQRYASQGVPTFVFHPSGKSEAGVEKQVGSSSAKEFEDNVTSFLAKNGSKNGMKPLKMKQSPMPSPSKPRMQKNRTVKKSAAACRCR